MKAGAPHHRSGVSRSLAPAVALLMLSVIINYIDRSNISVAAPLLEHDFRLSAGQLGILFSSFFWTYALFQILSGWLVDYCDVNWVLAGGLFLWSAATVASGLAGGFVSLLCLRLLLGVGESVAFPAYSKIFATHLPPERRGLANALIGAGLAWGPAIGVFTGGLLVARLGWRPLFVLLGLTSLLWLVPWSIYMPRTMPTGATNEPNTGAPPLNTMQEASPTLGMILRRRSLWGACGGQFCANYVLYFLLTWFPYYLVRERHFSMQAMARFGGLTYLTLGTATILTGWASDRWIASGQSINLVRKLTAGVGMAAAGILAGLSVVAGPLGSQMLLVAAFVFLGVYNPNPFLIAQTIAGKRAAGRWVGVQNSIGNLAGVLAPALTGLIVLRTGRFLWAFVVVTAVALIGAASWVFVVGRIEEIAWQPQPLVPNLIDPLVTADPARVAP